MLIPLGALGQVYVVSASIGVIFVLLNFLLGHFGEIDTGEDGGTGTDFSGDDGGTGTDFSGDDGGAGTDYMPGGAKMPVAIPTSTKIATGFSGILISILSPMTIALYLTFFGTTGMVLASTTPQLGLLTLIPSVIVSLLMGAFFKNLMKWMMRNMHSSSHQKDADLIGQIAQVNIPITEGRTGEITYVLNSKRLHASAKPIKEGIAFTRGSNVIIVGIKDHLVYVDACGPELDSHLEDHRLIS